MSRESLIIISRLIVAAVFITSILAMALGDFFITLITVSGGLIVWLLYLLAADLGPSQEADAAETTFGKTLSKVVAGLGGILAISAFRSYGIEETMWGGYAFDLAGLALALAILWVTIMPLVILQLMSKPLRQSFDRTQDMAQGRPRAPAAPESERPAAAMPEQPIYYGTPYPQEPDAYEGDYIEYDEEGEEWEGEEEEGGEDYYEDEEGYEYEDEDEYEEDEGENEDVR